MQSVPPNTPLTEAKLPQRIWSHDPFAQDPLDAVIVGERIQKSIPAVDKLILVLDESQSVGPFIADLTAQLAGLRHDKVTVLFSSEVERNPFQKPRDLSTLSDWRARHGSDNLPALHRATNLLYKEVNTAAVVWLHGPQPSLSSPTPLKQALSHQTGISLYDVTLSPGTNVIAANLKHLPQFRVGPTMGKDFDKRFVSFLKRLTEGQQQAKWEVTRQSVHWLIHPDAIEVNDQFARYTKYLEGMEAWREQRSVAEDWSKRLAHYQLVTPISGAVVLERQEQYDQHGLEQVDKKTVPHMPSVPSVPEPSSTLLLMLGIFAIGLRRKR